MKTFIRSAHLAAHRRAPHSPWRSSHTAYWRNGWRSGRGAYTGGQSHTGPHNHCPRCPCWTWRTWTLAPRSPPAPRPWCSRWTGWAAAGSLGRILHTHGMVIMGVVHMLRRAAAACWEVIHYVHILQMNIQGTIPPTIIDKKSVSTKDFCSPCQTFEGSNVMAKTYWINLTWVLHSYLLR